MDRSGTEDTHRAGPYTLLARERTVGGGELFAARADDGRLVTVRIVEAGHAAVPGVRDRLRAAVAAARTLSGDFLVPLLDADADAPAPWLATRFTAGLSLRQAVDRHGPLTEPALRLLAGGLARALATLHAAGTVHGEVGPDSVLVTMDGPRIDVLGVPGATGGPPPAPTDDMSALGWTVVFAASGDDEDTGALPASLREVIDGCLYPEPVGRPTAEQLVDYLEHQNLPAPRGSWLPPAVTADLAAAAAAVGALAASGDRGPAPPPPARAAGTGVSRRNLVVLLAGGAVLAGGGAAALAISGGSSPSPARGAGGAGTPAPSGPPSGAPATSAPSASASSADGPEPIVLAGPDAAPAWSRAGKYAPTCLEATDEVIMVVGRKSTSFLAAATGKRAFDALNTKDEFGASMGRHPTAHADGVFYLLCDTPDQFGLLMAFDAARGKVKWAVNLAAGDPGGAEVVSMYSKNYVAVAGKTVYVCGQVRELDGKSSFDEPTTGYIRAFDAATGKVRWEAKGTDINNVLVPPSGSRLLAASAVPAKKPGQVRMIDAARKGARGWKKPVPHTSYYFTTGWPLTCYAAGLFLFAGGAGDTLLAVDAATGREKWQRRFEARNGDQVRIGTPFPSVDGGTVHVPVGSDLVALATADGTARWVARLDGASDTGGANLFKSSLRLGGRHAQCSADTVFATDSANTLWAIDEATGRARWKYTDDSQPDVGFLWTVGGDRVFIASHMTMTAIAARRS
ncbi:PQQ-binding-like beta-propeller repeat protein [Streptomyces californicus]|uniref:outer membrane protein assembly factor BamB family protein n=1 Tax=Streptomyces californicus TaxID=67351 RepID=UPI0034D95590